jgi:hypothetical protein
MISNLIKTVIAFFVYMAVISVVNPLATLITGAVAGNQFDNSATSYLTTSFVFTMSNVIYFVSTFGLFFALFAIWQNKIKEFIAASTALLLLVMIAHPQQAFAYADTVDKTEAYTILPNESAFWIPDVGANKDTQAKFDSESYLSDNKIAAKRFIVPHAKLSNSGGFLNWDFYVPTGRLIIVDRTPYSREWVKSANRGTSTSDQSFPCQSKEGLNITAGVSIGASVSEADAAKFLYRFGVVPQQGNRNDPQVIFTSVYYGRSLANVMDDVGRKKVQTLVCSEIGKRSFDQANEEMIPMMESIQKNVKEYFASVGITLDFIGWADTFEFDQSVQKAVNDRYIATKLASALPILQAVAGLRVQEGLGAGLDKHGLPIVVTPQMLETLSNLAPKAEVKQ